MAEEYVLTPTSGSTAVYVVTPEVNLQPQSDSDNEVMDARALRDQVAALKRDKKLLNRELGEARTSSSAGPAGPTDP